MERYQATSRSFCIEKLMCRLVTKRAFSSDDPAAHTRFQNCCTSSLLFNSVFKPNCLHGNRRIHLIFRAFHLYTHITLPAMFRLYSSIHSVLQYIGSASRLNFNPNCPIQSEVHSIPSDCLMCATLLPKSIHLIENRAVIYTASVPYRAFHTHCVRIH